jgi:hypothetical protein
MDVETCNTPKFRGITHSPTQLATRGMRAAGVSSGRDAGVRMADDSADGAEDDDEAA